MTAEPGPEFMLHLVFDTGHQSEIPVTFYEPVMDGPRLVGAEIRQETLQLGDTQISYIDWSRVIFAGVYSSNQAFTR